MEVPQEKNRGEPTGKTDGFVVFFDLMDHHSPQVTEKGGAKQSQPTPFEDPELEGEAAGGDQFTV